MLLSGPTRRLLAHPCDVSDMLSDARAEGDADADADGDEDADAAEGEMAEYGAEEGEGRV